jgi:hypothetical protein
MSSEYRAGPCHALSEFANNAPYFLGYHVIAHVRSGSRRSLPSAVDSGGGAGGNFRQQVEAIAKELGIPDEATIARELRKARKPSRGSGGDRTVRLLLFGGQTRTLLSSRHNPTTNPNPASLSLTYKHVYLLLQV